MEREVPANSLYLKKEQQTFGNKMDRFRERI